MHLSYCWQNMHAFFQLELYTNGRRTTAAGNELRECTSKREGGGGLQRCWQSTDEAKWREIGGDKVSQLNELLLAA